MQHRTLFEALRGQAVEVARQITIAHLRHTEVMASRSLLARCMAELGEESGAR